MLRVNQYEQHLGARLLDFFDSRTPWHRALWNPGLPLTLREIREASQAQRAGVLGPDATRYLCNSAMTLVGLDPGAGTEQQRRLLQETLRASVRFESLDYRIIERVSEDIETHYLSRWASVIADESRRPQPERGARSIASYLLDIGFSPDFLHRWWTLRIRGQSSERPLGELVDEARQLAESVPQEHEVLIAFERIARTREIHPDGWIEAPAVAEWLGRNNSSRLGIRQSGGMVMRVRARDEVAAVEQAGENLDKLAARVSLSLRGDFRAWSSAWVKGIPMPIPLRSRSRKVRVSALQRERKVYSEAKHSVVDAAIELIAALASSSPGPAVASGWAALEAILSESGDRGCAAERMAALVACSLPRAELTLLSYSLERLGHPWGPQLSGCASNRDRCYLLAEAILRGDSVLLESEADKAALARMGHLLKDPPHVISDIEAHLASAFRRLYRHRNLVLHWGRTESVALRATLRTAAPLVGAGMDRVAHAWFVDGVEPIPLAAKARVRLANLTPGGGLATIDLLT